MRSILFLLPFLLFACSDDDQITGIDDFESAPGSYIKTGTFFGFCAGYCFLDVEIQDGEAMLRSYTHPGQGAPDKHCDRDAVSIESTLWNLYDNGVFNGLPTTIGCPDCADGGGEWIEVHNGTSVHSVTFEYGADVVQITNFLSALRAQREFWTNECFQ